MALLVRASVFWSFPARLATAVGYGCFCTSFLIGAGRGVAARGAAAPESAGLAAAPLRCVVRAGAAGFAASRKGSSLFRAESGLAVWGVRDIALGRDNTAGVRLDGVVRAGGEPIGLERAGLVRAGVVRAAGVRTGVLPAVVDRTGVERAGVERTGVGLRGDKVPAAFLSLDFSFIRASRSFSEPTGFLSSCAAGGVRAAPSTPPWVAV